MTLDEAKDAFAIGIESDETWKHAAEYVAVASEYWSNGIISDETYGAIVKNCAPYL